MISSLIASVTAEFTDNHDFQEFTNDYDFQVIMISSLIAM